MKLSKNLIFATSAIVIVGLAWVILSTDEADASDQITNDAYLRAHFTAVSPRISGQIETVSAADYHAVKQGDVLFELDNAEQKVAVNAAEAELARAQATHTRLEAELVNQKNKIAIAESRVDAAQARLNVANADKTRYTNMAEDGSGTRQDQENAQTAQIEAKAALDAARLSLTTERDTIAIIEAQLAEADAASRLADARLDNAKLNLSYTRVTAPSDGVVSQRDVRVGGYIHAGERALMLVPKDDLFIEAHFRETQVAHMKVGDPVTITFDSLPDEVFHGTIETFAPASGASYSPVDPINATGNFTKIVQRLPVRIQFDATAEQQSYLRVGMSAIVDVEII